MFYAKIKLMRNKNIKTGALVGLAGLSASIVLGAAISKKLEERRREKIKARIRQYFDGFGDIDVLYINEFESDKEITTGGLVMSDGRVLSFTYKKGVIDYSEDEQ